MKKKRDLDGLLVVFLFLLFIVALILIIIMITYPMFSILEGYANFQVPDAEARHLPPLPVNLVITLLVVITVVFVGLVTKIVLNKQKHG